MLETRELCKIYKPKKGVPVTALNKISLKFPEKGMVFLLGKSGSGKSTLLNLLGGLDKYDDGEIIIKGVSSKDFKQEYFDSYRNTYVGFIFQEYNILDEFTVGANIALALQLQGKKAADEEINNILKQVDLDGYGNRKPNELSGGQKQRVAIARALVKNPEIIMADEPTGALDSNTGRQVFDTLKKLSKDKLVIIVSHDREFSELYADRIIELSDGNVISDVEVENSEEQEKVQDNLVFENEIISVKEGYHLTEEDRIAINDYIDTLGTEGAKIKLFGSRRRKKFVNTDESKIKEQDSKNFKLIKSKLPMKSAFKIGVSGLKHKKIRLVITILLSCIAFGLFGLSDTITSYNHVDVCTNSIIDSNLDYLSIGKAVKVYYNSNNKDNYYFESGRKLTEADVKKIEEKFGNNFIRVVTPVNGTLDFEAQIDNSVKLTETEVNIYSTAFSGFGEITKEYLDSQGYKLLAGQLPDGSKDEIAISEYIYETFHLAKYADKTEGENATFENINKYSDIIGKKININNKEYTITGVIDTKFSLDRYKGLTEKKQGATTTDQIIDYALANEFYYASQYSLSNIALVGEGFNEKFLKEQPMVAQLQDVYLSAYSDNSDINANFINANFIAKLEDIDEDAIQWIAGEKTSLGEKEIVVSEDAVNTYNDSEGTKVMMKEKYQISLFDRINDINETIDGYKVVGYIPSDYKNGKYNQTIITSAQLYNKCVLYESGIYSFIISKMPTDKNEIKDIIKYCYDTTGESRYDVNSSVTYELDTVNSGLKAVSKVFFYVGLGFAIFSAIMLANFIATSISYKKQEIGILRAIGSRSNDVFRIFFSESFVIAMINFVLSAVGVGVVTAVVNSFLRNRVGILVTVLSFGVRQVALIFVVSIAIAFVASFIPVKKIASKRPIDAIRNR